jgi:pyruvate/2-oxoglutarate dehydrogenase complex dihydrolipoamide acyltransferase (E2) component
MTGISLGTEAWKDIDPATEALVDKWLVAQGDTVEAGQPIASVVIVKATQEIVAPTRSCVEKILVPSGDTFAQGQPIAMLKELA